MNDRESGRGRASRKLGGSRQPLERLDALDAESLLAAIFDTARDAIFVKDAEGRYVKVNRAMCELWGLSEADLVGRTVTEALGGEVAEISVRGDARVLQGEIVEEEHEQAIGSILHTFSSVKVPLENDRGEVIGLFAIVRDITARKWAEQALRESERRLTTLMNNLPGMVYRCRNDREWTMEFVSQGSEALLGFRPEALVDNAEVAYGDLVEPEDAARVWEIVQAALKRNETFELEYRVRTADGELRWVVERGVGVGEHGGRQLIEGFITDVTRRVEADEALRRRLELESLTARIASDFVRVELSDLGQAVEAALGRIAGFSDADRVYIVTLDGPEQRINLAFDWCAEGLEKPHSELGGRSFAEFGWWRVVLMRDGPISVEDVSQLPADANAESAYWTAMGVKAVLGVPLWMEDELMGYLVLHDVRSARRWREEDLSLLRSVGPILAHALMRSRTEAEKRSLEHQLQHAQKIEAIGRLAGGVAHDFNNLLTAIGGYAELAMEAQAGGQSPVEDIQQILEATERATGLTQQLLAFSRRQEQRPRRVDLNGVIAQARKMLQRMIGEDIVLEVHQEDDLRSVEMDPGQIDQLLLNLAVNARDAMPEGGRLKISTYNSDLDEEFCRSRDDLEPGAYVTLEVSDTGVGMDQEVLERIFDPFFTTKEVGKGTGLGLSTVYGVVRQYGGWVDVRSVPGRGSSFIAFIPAAGQESGPGSAEDPSPAEGPGGGERVLVVEDDPAVRRLARQVLESHGYEVEEAESGDQALAACRARPGAIDLVFSDVVMPGLSGRELARKLGQEDPSIRVLLTSGYEPENGDDESPDERRAPALLAKPFSGAELLRMVRQVLDQDSREPSSDV